MTDDTSTTLAPRLVVDAGDDALGFYAQAFDSEATDQMYDGERLVNGHVLVGTTLLGVTEEDGEQNRSPSSIGGTPVLLGLTVDDVDDAAARFVDAGGEIVIPVDDRPYGRRDGRLRDPFGHLWIIGQAELSGAHPRPPSVDSRDGAAADRGAGLGLRVESPGRHRRLSGGRDRG